MNEEWKANHISASKDAPKYLLDQESKIKELMDTLYADLLKLEKDYKDILSKGNTYETGIKIHDIICTEMMQVRKSIDAYEVIASNNFYKIPTYKDMLFSL